MSLIRIRSSAGPYDVICARGVLTTAARRVAALGKVTSVFILTSPRVWESLGRDLRKAFSKVPRHNWLVFDDAESRKDLPTVEGLCRALVEAGADRHSVIVAVGGGVVGDVAGFVAASLLRGVRLVHVPTTVVAQVDSAIGGKTGVNLPEGKNLVGAFYPPKLVLADPATLRTLPHREFRSGLYEVIKYGVIADPQLFSLLEEHMLTCLRRDPAILGRVIERCARIKARVVVADERESGLRQILNFGHTLGHTFEAATGYKKYLHGEAVGLGMISATLIAMFTRRLPLLDAFRIIRLTLSVGPLEEPPAIPRPLLKRLLRGDKKSLGGHVRWVLPRKIGKVKWGEEVSQSVVAEALQELPAMVRGGVEELTAARGGKK